MVEDKQQQVIRDFDELEVKKIGASTHEKYHSLVHELQNKYISVNSRLIQKY